MAEHPFVFPTPVIRLAIPRPLSNKLFNEGKRSFSKMYRHVDSAIDGELTSGTSQTQAARLKQKFVGAILVNPRFSLSLLSINRKLDISCDASWISWPIDQLSSVRFTSMVGDAANGLHDFRKMSREEKAKKVRLIF